VKLAQLSANHANPWGAQATPPGRIEAKPLVIMLSLVFSMTYTVTRGKRTADAVLLKHSGALLSILLSADYGLVR
jgi:hypothetical protein